MIIHNVVQGTKEWAALRGPIPTASEFDRIITPGGKKSTAQEKYMMDLLACRIMGHPSDEFISKWMSRGNEMEERAVSAYEFQTDTQTEQVGFITTDDGLIGASPDRLIVGVPGLLECKAPSPAVHVGYLLAAAGAATEYRVQLQGQLWITERDWVDIISYHPEMPEALFRVNREEEYIKELASHVRSFVRQLEDKTEILKERGWIKQIKQESADIPHGLGLTTEEIREYGTPGVHYRV